MEVRPQAGLQIIPLPNGKVAIVFVQIAGPNTTRRIAEALFASLLRLTEVKMRRPESASVQGKVS